MSVYYSVYSEANIDGRWYSLCPCFRDGSGQLRTASLYEEQTLFREVHNELRAHSIGVGLPEDLSEGLRAVFHEDPDGEIDRMWNRMTWREYYRHCMYQVNLAQAVTPKILRTKPYKYEGYVRKDERAAFAVGELEEFSEWLTEEAYLALPEAEQRRFIYHRWNDPYGKYRIYSELYRRVRTLCELFRLSMRAELQSALQEEITDSQIRLIVLFG